jgi:hypothetical protein
MKLKCPWCGATGTDAEPYADGPPIKGQEDYAFEVRGNCPLVA